MRCGDFCARFWRPAFDGDPDSTQVWLRSPVLPGFTFNEGRHTHRTWLAEDGVPEVARAARLGHRMRGMGEVYEHVTPAMKERVRTVLEDRWRHSLHTLKEAEREWLVETVPRLGEYYRAPDEKRDSEPERDRLHPRSPKRKEAAEAASDLRCCWWAIQDSNL
ncbi:hypothetical protein ACFQZ2_03185 [Streptomonospora algeriensis]|uniref:Integrase n=1 Tax=Streptomonospora algeriensis TaxID=995084 RepID=A0ABW3BCQ5_9ACTN